MTIDFPVLGSVLIFAVTVETLLLVSTIPVFSVGESLTLLVEVALPAALLWGAPSLLPALFIVISLRAVHTFSFLTARRIRRGLARRTGRLFLAGLLGEQPVTRTAWLLAYWRLRKQGGASK